MLKLESPHNDTFKKFLSLTGAKGLKKEGLFLLSGQKLISEFLENPELKIYFELVPPRARVITASIHVHLKAELFNQIDVLGTDYNILVVEQPEIVKLHDISVHKPRGLELVLPVGDPGNLGALLRSAEAFGVPAVILTQEAAHPFLPKSVKASAGSALRVPMARGPSLRDFPDTCIGLDMDGTPIDKFKWPDNGLLVVGEEGAGFAAKGKRKFKKRVRIPTEKVQSLNVVVAASVALAIRNTKL